jgi:hypothetical protein
MSSLGVINTPLVGTDSNSLQGVSLKRPLHLYQDVYLG